MGDTKGYEYWTSKEKNRQILKFIEIFDLLHPGHMMLVNVDW